MNNDVRSVINKHKLYAKSYTIKNNSRILNTNKGKYVIKKSSCSKKSIYDYLLSRGFDNFLAYNEIDSGYEIYPFIEEVNVTKDQKAVDLVNLLALLHNKTTFYQQLSLDELKKIYEENMTKLNYLNNYYHDLQDVIERKVYMAPDEYLLIRNISKVYDAIFFSINTLNSWYNEAKEKRSFRKALLHNNIKVDHLISSNEKLLLSWDKANSDFVIYDFLNFYKNEYNNLDMNKLFEIYQSKYPYTACEQFLFFSILSIPNKFVFKKHDLESEIEVYNFVKYIDKSRNFILKKNKKYQKTNK